MKPIIQLNNVADINRFVHCTTKHPLVAVVDFSKVDEYIEEGTRISAGFYSIMFKNYCANTLRYGRQSYDFQEGSLICIAPKQVLMMDSEIERKDNMMGWGLFFHPELLRGTALGSKMKEYTFFSYDTSEALHLSEKEKQTLFDCVQNIEAELHENIDSHSQNLIVTNIELLLNYCLRYYGRQFITRRNSYAGIVSRVDEYLSHYYQSAQQKETGIPTVKSLANHLHLSPGYLSDFLRKETGRNAQDHIHDYLMEEARSILLHSEDTVSQIAYSLGFEYPQYFSKLFKQKTGKTPGEYRQVH